MKQVLSAVSLCPKHTKLTTRFDGLIIPQQNKQAAIFLQSVGCFSDQLSTICPYLKKQFSFRETTHLLLDDTCTAINSDFASCHKSGFIRCKIEICIGNIHRLTHIWW